ncbi:hypothetical protein O71_08787 [Pontibacter sp. BAB1700]|nr:hypothetical protein O71_08787 [Pontibacter sp. BAB1700]
MVVPTRTALLNVPKCVCRLSYNHVAAKKHTPVDIPTALSPTHIHVGLPIHDQYLLLRQEHISIVIAEMVSVSLLGAINLCQVSEIKACQLQVLAWEGGLTLRTELLEDAAVLS